MSLNFILKYVFSTMLVGCLLILGCSHNKPSEEISLESIPVPPENSKKLPDLTEIIQQAEVYYETGCEHYKQHQWVSAQQEFDKALELLLDADGDAETHYRLSQTYDRLFYKIHKLELERSYLRGVLEEPEEAELAQSTEQLEAFLSSTQPEVPASKSVSVQKSIYDELFKNPPGTLGEFVIDESDAEIMKHIKQFSHERSQYRKGLERGTQYFPMMVRTFQEHHIPSEL